MMSSGGQMSSNDIMVEKWRQRLQPLRSRVHAHDMCTSLEAAMATKLNEYEAKITSMESDLVDDRWTDVP
jgi:hypothetical protein